MSLVPLLLDLADELDSSLSPFYRRTNNFGFGIDPRRFSLNRWNRDASLTGFNKTQIGKDGFQVSIDVADFAPNEISVKTVDDSIIVEGNHEERQDEHGYISRQIKRRYTLPTGYNVKDVVSTLSSDGVLTVKAPPETKALEGGNERVIQIQQTGPARLTIGKEKAAESTEEKKE